MVASSCDSFFLCLSIAAFFFNVVIVCCCGCVFLLLFCLVVVVCADRLPVVDRIPASPRVGRKKKTKCGKRPGESLMALEGKKY